jgi:hypothetical protein
MLITRFVPSDRAVKLLLTTTGAQWRHDGGNMTADSKTGRAEASVAIAREDIDRAVAAGVIQSDQADALWRFLTEKAAAAARPTIRPRFDLVHLLWYAGALIVIGAMGLFTTLAFARLGGAALAVIALIYAVILVMAGDRLWRRGLTIPGGLLITIAVTMAPIFVYGVQEALGWLNIPERSFSDLDAFWRFARGGWVPMELATVVAGLVALRFYRFPFLIAVVAIALWSLSMDVAPWIFGEPSPSWRLRRLVSVWFGLGTMIVAWTVDIRSRGDFAFWLHLFGPLAFWGGLTAMESDSDLSRALYCLINVGLIGFGLFLQRRAYVLLGGLGVAIYLHDLAERVFRDSLLYPFALSMIGLAIIGAGLLLHRHGATLERTLQRRLPRALAAFRPPHAR